MAEWKDEYWMLGNPNLQGCPGPRELAERERDDELPSQSRQLVQPIGFPPLTSESSFSQGMACRGGTHSPAPQGGGSQAPSVSPQRGFVLGAKSSGNPEAAPWQPSKAVALSQALPGLYNSGFNPPEDSLYFVRGETEVQESETP